MAKKLVDQVKEAAGSPPQKHEKQRDWSKVASTGSLLLDLAISGLRCERGGLPGGVIVEISGPPGSGKTTIMAELVGSAQRQGGQVRIKDPEQRLDPPYCKQMGVRFDPSIYSRPDTVTEVIEGMIGPLVVKDKKTQRDHSQAWTPDPNFLNCDGTDSLAALSTRMEIEQGDKMGQRRAKELSEGMRLIARHIGHHNILTIFTNQLRDNVDGGQFAPKTVTPGGHAIPFYASVRIQLRPAGKIQANKDSPILGKMVEAFIGKNSLDIEWRTAPIRLMFGYGIDDVGANLIWLKEHNEMDDHPTDPGKKAAGYVIGDKYFPANMAGGPLSQAIKYVEENNLEDDIRDWVAEAWRKAELTARPPRKEKAR
jgi:recombination protein RecA